MTKTDFSEFRESASLLSGLRLTSQKKHGRTEKITFEHDEELLPEREIATILAKTRNLHTQESMSRMKRIEKTLTILCEENGYESALLADDQGLLLSAIHPPTDTDTLAAYTTYLKKALDRTRKIFPETEPNDLFIHLEENKKIFLHGFDVRKQHFFLLITASADASIFNQFDIHVERLRALLY